MFSRKTLTLTKPIFPRMKSLKPLILSVIFACTATSCATQKSVTDQKNFENAVTQMHSRLEDLVKKDVPSFNVLMKTPKGEFFYSAVGKNGKPVTKNDWFRIASNTKNFTATAILKMMQDGWLNIDDKITQNIPGTNISYTSDEPELQFPHRDLITIKELLQHNAGVYDLSNDTSQLNIGGKTYTDFILEKDPLHKITTEECLRILKEKNLTYGVPNTVYHYSNVGYYILGDIISKVYSAKSAAKKSYADYLHDYVTGPAAKVPLQVRFVDSPYDQELPSPHVIGSIYFDGELYAVEKENIAGNVAGGNGIGTMEDLSKYISTLFSGKNVLNRKSIELMTKSYGVKQDREKYALGTVTFPGLGYGHHGTLAGCMSEMMYDPETGVSVVILIPFYDFSNMDILIQSHDMMKTAAMEARRSVGY